MYLWLTRITAPFAVAVQILAGLPPQAAVRISGPPECAGCEFRLERMVTLRDVPESGPPVVGPTAMVVRDAGGRIYLVHGNDTARVQVFGPDGAHIGSVGSRGRGPGEFTSAGPLLVDARGSLYVFDRFQYRMAVFSPTLELLETRFLPPRFRPRKALFLDGGFLVAASAYTEELLGYPLHLLTHDLDIERSFGMTDQDQTVRPDMVSLQLRSLAKAGDQGIWAAPYNEYKVEAWDPATGELTTSLERSVEWFPPWHFARSLSLDSPPQPVLRGIWQDDKGLLWVLVAVAAEGWRDAIHMTSGGDLALHDSERYRDTIIEVLDPNTQTLLVSTRVPHVLVGFTNDGLIIGNASNEVDGDSVELWRAILNRSPQKPVLPRFRERLGHGRQVGGAWKSSVGKALPRHRLPYRFRETRARRAAAALVAATFL